MAALSYYTSNWGGAFQQLDSEMNILAHEPQPELLLPQDILSFPDVWSIDSLFDPPNDDDNNNNNNNLFYPEDPDSYFNENVVTDNNTNSIQFDFSTADQVLLNSLPPPQPQPAFPVIQQEFEPDFHYPKRQKHEEIIYSDYNAFFNEAHVPSPCLNFQDYQSLMPTLPDFPNGPPVFSAGSCDNVMKKETTTTTSGGTTLSAQSIAARQRRRRITEKTQELGKLIPGGQKMNTAEMLQAASKYIKYMQAQVGILELMGSNNQMNEEGFGSEELHGLLESPLIQEKLYSTEKCLVPRKFVQELSNDRQIVESNRGLLPILKEEH